MNGSPSSHATALTAVEPEPQGSHSLLAWAGLFALGFFCLAGRWNASLPGSPGYSSPAYFLNGALALVFLPTFYYCLRLLLPQAHGLCRSALGVAWLVIFLPYRWMGLSSLYRPSGANEILGPASIHPQVWLQEALGKGLSVMPYEALFVGLLLAAGVWLARKLIAAQTYPRAAVYFWAALYSLLVISAWMHLSNRSPYTYLSLNQDGPVWYARGLCPDDQCLAEGDYFVFKAGEDVFKGESVAPAGTMLLRRPVMSFVSAQFSYFFNPWYVYLILNLASWFLACYFLYRYGEPLWGQEIAKYAAILTACGPGFISYVAQPMAYAGGLAAVAIALGLFQAIFEEGRETARSRFLLFGGVLGLMLLSYDHFTFLIFFFIAALLRRLPLVPFMGSLLTGILIYAGFNHLTGTLNLPVDLTNSTYANGTVTNIKAMILGGHIGDLITGMPQALFIFKRSLLYSLFYVTPCLALLGAVLGWKRWHAVLESLLLVFCAFVGVAALHFGGLRWMFCELAELPRFAFVAYPGIYLLAGSGIVSIRQRVQSLFGADWGLLAAFAILAGIFLMANVDVFGYPHLYYNYQWPWGGTFP